jgi:hypothetical protein
MRAADCAISNCLQQKIYFESPREAHCESNGGKAKAKNQKAKAMNGKRRREEEEKRGGPVLYFRGSKRDFGRSGQSQPLSFLPGPWRRRASTSRNAPLSNVDPIF